MFSFGFSEKYKEWHFPKEQNKSPSCCDFETEKSLFSFGVLSADVWQLHFFFPDESCASKFKSQEMLSVWTAQWTNICEPPSKWNVL